MYFETPGRENIDAMLELVKKRAEELGIKDIVLASTRGFTAGKALEALKEMDVRLTAVGIGRDSFPSDLAGQLEEKGHNVCFSRETTYEFPEHVKAAYRAFCEGMKVAVEVAMIAAERDLVPTDGDVISVGKWDTAILITPARSGRFGELRIKELLCKPW